MISNSRSFVLNVFQSGLIIRLPFVDKMEPEEYFNDVKHWDGVVPIDGDLESRDQGYI